MTPRWPNLGFDQIGELDHTVMQYEPEKLRCIGARLQAGLPLTDIAPLPEIGLAPPLVLNPVGPRPLEWDLGQLLLELANNSAALRKLNSYSERSAQVRELNMAVHFAATWELLGKSRTHAAKARGEVAGAWKAKDTSVKDAWLNRHKEAEGLVEHIVRLCADRWERRDTLKRLCKDMCIRARFPWAQPVKRRRK